MYKKVIAVLLHKHQKFLLAVNTRYPNRVLIYQYYIISEEIKSRVSASNVEERKGYNQHSPYQNHED